MTSIPANLRQSGRLTASSLILYAAAGHIQYVLSKGGWLRCDDLHDTLTPAEAVLFTARSLRVRLDFED